MTINELKHEVTGRLFALIGVERLEHFHYNFDLGFGYNRENFDELHAVQAASAEPLEEIGPADLVLFHALGGA